MVIALRILLLVTLCIAAVAEAAVDVRIERTTVSVNDSIRVVFVADSPVGDPDFSPLRNDFDVLGTSRSSNVSVVNGAMEQTLSWIVDLMPRRAGELTIPPLRFGSESSPERTITVTPAGNRPDAPNAQAFLEVEAKPVDPYVQAQIRFSARVFLGTPAAEASLTEPRIASGDAVIERLGEDVVYETTRGGTRFTVIERRYAIFPQQSGTIVIDPIVFDARLGGQSSFFGRSGGRRVRVRSEAMEIDVKPIPGQFPGQVWLPAEQVILSEDWPGDNNEWRVGEPLTRSLTLRARGLTASQLPEIGMAVPEGFKQYPDQPQLDTRASDSTQLAVRSETVALIPSQAGQFTLPAIEVPWWNTTTDRLEFARLPARTVRVLPATVSAADTNTPSLPAAAPIETPTGASPELVASGDASGAAGTWRWLAMVFALLWLATLTGWWWSSRRREHAPAAATQKPPKPAAAIAALDRACAAGDAAGAQAAILQWATAKWPGNPARSLGELAARLDGPMQEELHRLSRARFGAAAAAWDGGAFWQAFRTWQSRRGPKPPPPRPQLEPLYRDVEARRK